MSVSRETVARLGELADRYELPVGAADRLVALLAALAAEPDPPTTRREPAQAADEHVADSLSGLEAPELRGASRIADIGSGAGFPGLPLAVALPAASIDLVEATRRKCEVIDRLALAAGAENARSVAARVEELGLADYDVVTARAVAPLGVLAEYAAPLLGNEGVLLAWKGQPEESEESVGSSVAMEFDRALSVQPFPAARSRRLVVLRKTGPTPPEFPRRPGMARKRPLV